jgi:hypothetical protein
VSLPITLNTNEIKNSAGAEVEFSRLENGPGRSLLFAATAETPALLHRLSISHQEIGAGLLRRRRSKVRIDKTSISTVDLITPVTTSFYSVSDIPVGALAAFTEPTTVCAELISFLASLGASTTILYDGTGNGAAILINGSL